MTMADRIRECRKAAGLTQDKVAEALDVSRQAVTKWESGQSAPSMENLIKLAGILGTTVDFLIKSDTDTTSVAEQVYRMLKDEEARKEAEQQLQKKKNRRCTLAVAGMYLLIFLLCKLFWCSYDLSEVTVLGWLTSTSAQHHRYLFGWLLNKQLFFYASMLSILFAAFGRRRIAIATLTGFALGLPLGEYLGAIPALVPEGYHYGWAIWYGIYLGGLFLGVFLQKLPEDQLSIKSQKLYLGLLLACVWCIAVVALIFVLIPPAYY